MKELIPINEKDGQQVVSARELHAYLAVETNFTTWCKRMFGYGFVENQDYIILSKNGTNKISKSNPMDYALTLDCAKEISMLQRTDKGKQARQYFIEVEKTAKGFLSEYLNDPIMMIRKDQIDANRRITNLEHKQSSLEEIVSIEMKIDKEKLRIQQAQLDRLWDIQDRKDLYSN